MYSDIDQFIRDQKSKIADERNYLRKNQLFENKVKINNKLDSGLLDSHMSSNDGFVLKMREGENMKNKFKQELRNEFSMSNKLNKHIESYSARSEKHDSFNTSEDQGLLHGMKYSNSASKRKEKIRNEEYNQFKKTEEEKFKNRFSNKKNIRSEAFEDNNSYIKSNPISFPVHAPKSPEHGNNHIFTPVISQRQYVPNSHATKSYQNVTTSEHAPNYPKTFESKIDELERKVEELRNFRIQNPYIIYPADETERTRGAQIESKPYNNGLNSFRYSTTNLGKSHLKYLEETENRLRDIEDKYDMRKSNFMTNQLNNNKKLYPILDDKELFEGNIFDKKPIIKRNEKNEQNDFRSIIPTSRDDDDAIKKRKQENYRRELENQMKENSIKSRSLISNENNTFFDRFGQKDLRKNNYIPEKNVEKNNDYFFYASHNPLELDFGTDIAPSSFNLFPEKQTEKKKFHDYALQGNVKKESNIFFGEQNNSDSKFNYRNDLIKQIEESKIRKEIEKNKLEDYERRKNEEISRYEPFGRGGGGAPLKNEKGETISDLKRIMFDPDIVKRDISPPKSTLKVRADYVTEPNSEPPNSQRGFARGGHGIFGKALSDEDKIKADRYKEELQIQIEKNKRQKSIDKENERIKEENERIKFEKEQKQIQIELENERKRQQEKELDQRQMLEESKAAALKQKEINDNKMIQNKKKEERIFSPVIHNEPVHEDRSSLLDRSQLEIEATNRAEIHREDSKIMNQLFKLKSQLESEKLRVEQALLRQRDEVEIYDPRLNISLKKPNNKNDDNFNSDVFQTIVDNKKPLTVRRNHVKNKPLESINAYKDTEADLYEYLQQQERLLERMNQKDFSKLELMMPKMEPKDVALRPGTHMSNQLESDSAFIHFDQSNDFNLRNSHSLESGIGNNYNKTRSPMLSSNLEFGSNTSLNIDELTRKNQQRLRKLQKLQDENDSNQSSEDILNKIVSVNNNDLHLFNGLK